MPVDLDTLNKDQRTVFDEVMEHHERWSHRTPHSPVPQYTGMVCGTAGSGKTHLIRALKQGVGDGLMVLAPTGVAADNIGGQTYHSVLPMPFKNRRVLTWDGPKKGSDRHKRMVNELENVEWIIIDGHTKQLSIGRTKTSLSRRIKGNLTYRIYIKITFFSSRNRSFARFETANFFLISNGFFISSAFKNNPYEFGLIFAIGLSRF